MNMVARLNSKTHPSLSIHEWVIQRTRALSLFDRMMRVRQTASENSWKDKRGVAVKSSIWSLNISRLLLLYSQTFPCCQHQTFPESGIPTRVRECWTLIMLSSHRRVQQSRILRESIAMINSPPRVWSNEIESSVARIWEESQSLLNYSALLFSTLSSNFCSQICNTESERVHSGNVFHEYRQMDCLYILGQQAIIAFPCPPPLKVVSKCQTAESRTVCISFK